MKRLYVVEYYKCKLIVCKLLSKYGSYEIFPYFKNINIMYLYPSSEKREDRTHINIWNIHDMEVVDIITLVVANIKSTYAETRDKAECFNTHM